MHVLDWTIVIVYLLLNLVVIATGFYQIYLNPQVLSSWQEALFAHPTLLTPELLEGTLQEADETEANVATGYHAIEFLLWGQDLNGTVPGAGKPDTLTVPNAV